MRYWANIDDNNFVTRVIVGRNDDDGGYQWIIDNVGGRWLETEVSWQVQEGNPVLRKNCAGIGFYYDQDKDAFISPKPESYIEENGEKVDFIFNEDTCSWESIVVP
jgi:hypothetical protein